MTPLKHLIQLDYYSSRYRSAVLEIERLSFDRPWNAIRLADERGVFGRSCVVAFYQGAVAGHALYGPIGPHRELLNITRFAVHPAMRRHGVGRHLVELCKRRCTELLCEAVVANVPERNVAAQLLFKACGVPCDYILNGFDEATGEDLYRFVWAQPSSNVPVERKGAGV